MITSSDARYIISEIRNIPYYEERIERLQGQIKEIQMQIEMVTQPVSPNGGKDVVINGVSVRVKIPSNHSLDSASVINDLISKQMPLEASEREFIKRLNVAKSFRKRVLQQAETGFVVDFIDNRLPYRELATKYNISNPYDRMIRIIKNTIRKV